jgi:CHC2 zinc finger
MRDLSIITGPIDYSEEPGKTGDTPASSKKYSQELIQRANAVPIIHLFKLYKIRVDQFNKRTACPFKFHKNGQERTPSFWYYPDTNSFNCFGCHTGGSSTELVMHLDNIEKVKAATKILQLFEKEIDEDFLLDGVNIAERLEIMLDFSNAVLDFRQNHDDEHAFQFIEYVCWVYDRMNLLHEHDNDALRGLNVRLIDFIQAYQPNLRLIFEDKYLQVTCHLPL